MSGIKKSIEKTNYGDVSGEQEFSKKELDFIKNSNYLKETLHEKNKETIKTKIEGKIQLDELYAIVNEGKGAEESIKKEIFMAKIEELLGYIERNKKEVFLSNVYKKHLTLVV